ncbi:hypothetical protein HID58_039943 [Brassica napus]|uniref:Uncharacterized protein n=1 Tax=Brassica napus TaxID=3708 RepID=A0ABQ8B6M0_BRANA|nr:hypothetical protein HID58_039943 [Brassica napus]
MDSLKSDSNPLAKVPATVDVATVDPSVDMVLPTSGTPLLATISGGSFSASPKESDQPISTVTTSNAWSKPLSITQPSSAATVLMQTSKELIADLSRETQWPSLSAANCAPSRRRQPVARAINASRPSPHNSYSSSVTAKVPLGICDNDPEYPWASKMEKSKRNLHKVTSPEFLEDGTPKVRIPRHVLLEGLENQKEFVIGQFYRCSAPASGLIQSVSLKATKSAPLESQEKTDALSFDSQGCILLDHEGSGLPINENSEIEEPSREVTTVPSASVVAVNTPTGSFTEKVHVSCTPSEIVQVTHVTAVTDEKELPPPTVVSVSPNDETCKQLDVSVSPNDETCKQLDVAEPVDSSTQSVPPTPEAPSGKFVGNVDIVVDNSNSSPSSVPFVHDNLFAVLDSADASEPSSVPPAKELVFSNSPLPFTFASHDTSPTHPRDPFVDDESTLRSRGGRPLKPSQRLKEMEWFTVTGKGKRGRGRGPHH